MRPLEGSDRAGGPKTRESRKMFFQAPALDPLLQHCKTYAGPKPPGAEPSTGGSAKDGPTQAAFPLGIVAAVLAIVKHAKKLPRRW